MKKRLFLILFILTTIITLSSCKKNFKISIIATSDIHCGLLEDKDKNEMGLSNVSAYKNMRNKKGYKTTLVDCGDLIQGDSIGLLSKGSYVSEPFKEAGYELMTIGNHEFDYGINSLEENIDYLNKSNCDVLSCNLKYIGSGEKRLTNVKPYKIIDYKKYKIGYVGITSCQTITKSTPSIFKENGEFAYSLSNDTKELFYDTVQKSIDDCKNDGANYVVLMSHCGYGDEYGEYGSVPLMENVSGYDIILDGHSHKIVEPETHKDKDGNDKTLMCLGTKISCFGEVVFDSKGIKEVSLVKDYYEKDSKVDEVLNKVYANTQSKVSEKVSTSDLALSIKNGNIRLPRNRETQIGNFYADAFRHYYNSDIGFINGGGVRDGFSVGDITYDTLYKMAPFGNFGCVIEATGSQILDYLEFGARLRELSADNGEKAIGENGAFAVGSGIKYTIDTSIASPVVVDANGMFIKIEGERRIKDVYVLENGTYVSLDLAKTYTVATISYIAMDNGDGVKAFDGCNVLTEADKVDVDILADYFKYLNGDIKSKYENIEGRITII